MKRRRQRLSYRPACVAIERVEDRCLLAGVVSLSIANNGDLTVTGDDQDNHIEVTIFNDVWGRVTGIDGTLVEADNGVIGAAAVFPLGELETEFGTFAALLGDLTINMGDGDDNVDIIGTSSPLEPVAVEGVLDVDLGAGSDEFTQFVSYAGEGAEIRGGSGTFPDYISLREVVIPDELLIHTGATNNGSPDQILIDQSVIVDAELRGSSGRTEVAIDTETAIGDLGVFTGNDDDEIVFADSAVFGNARIDTGSASNSSPGDYVGIGSAVVGGNLRIDGRQGRQTIDFIAMQLDADFAVGGRTSISTRGGADSIRIDNSEPQTFIDEVDIRTGGGSDVVDIEADAEFQGDLEVRLGGGADTLEFVSDVQISGDGVLNGGGGFDSITNAFAMANWLSGDPTVNSFEDFI